MRFDELTENNMSAAQREVYQKICAGPKGKLGPPTSILLRAPEFADRVQKISEYVRYENPLAGRLMEFVILITARYWSCQYVWYAHHPLALKAGLSAAIASDLAQGKRPTGMKEDEAAAYQFCTELHRNKEVGDATFAAALKQFGEDGIVNLMAGCAYYTLQSMVLKVNQQSVPDGTPEPLPPLS